MIFVATSSLSRNCTERSHKYSDQVWEVAKYILLSTTNKMQRYTIFFIIVSALHVSGGFFAHHQELKNCTRSIWYVPGLLDATASLAHTRYCVYSS
jgi:hypothetical protein